MGQWPNANKNGAYILLVVDCFTRTVWCRQQQNLEAETTWRAYHDIVESSGRTPRLLWTDSGKSFTGKYFTSRLEAEGTKLIHTFGPAKSAFAEAANRTIGRRVYQKMTENNTEDWGPLLQECVDEYNAAKHSALGMSPDEASALDDDGMVELWHHLYDKWALKQPKYVMSPFKVGDRVRLSLQKGRFAKQRVQTWSNDIYTIVKVHATRPVTYTIEDAAGDVYKNVYAQEIMRTQFTTETQTQLLAPRARDDEVGPDQVRRFVGWRRIPKGKSRARKFPFELHAELGDGSREWVGIWRYIGVETRNGFKEATSGSNLGILRPADEYVMSVPELKSEVYDRL
jgi:hypothetical protein